MTIVAAAAKRFDRNSAMSKLVGRGEVAVQADDIFGGADKFRFHRVELPQEHHIAPDGCFARQYRVHVSL